MVCQRRGQKGQPTQTGKRHQRTKNSRQKSRTENQIADEEVKQSKKTREMSAASVFNLRNMSARACNCSALNTLKYGLPPKTTKGAS